MLRPVPASFAGIAGTPLALMRHSPARPASLRNVVADDRNGGVAAWLGSHEPTLDRLAPNDGRV